MYFTLKPLCILFGRKENGLEADTICKVFSHLNICFHYHIFIILHIEYEHSYLTLSSCINVKYTQLLESFVKLFNLPVTSTGTTKFCLVWIKLPIYAMNVSRTTALTRKLKPPEAPFISTDDPRFLWLK